MIKSFAGQIEEVTIPVLELPTVQPIVNMITKGEPTCMYDGIQMQNGLTTSQVINFILISILLSQMY